MNWRVQLAAQLRGVANILVADLYVGLDACEELDRISAEIREHVDGERRWRA